MGSPVAGAVSPVAAAASPAAGVASLVVYGCCAWPLSLDATCAHEARLVFREAASGLGLPDDLIYLQHTY